MPRVSFHLFVRSNLLGFGRQVAARGCCGSAKMRSRKAGAPKPRGLYGIKDQSNDGKHLVIPSGQHRAFLVGGFEHEFHFSIHLGMSSSQLTFIPSFFRGVGRLKPPTSIIFHYIPFIFQLYNHPMIIPSFLFIP